MNDRTLPSPDGSSERALARPAGNLPAQLSSFVGRERELAELARLVEQARLLTLTGPGGSGKTRLALEVAESVADRFAGGAWFVDLAPLRDPDLVVSSIGVGLDVRPNPQRSLGEALLDRLSAAPTLLVLDNLEQIPGAGHVIADLLARSRSLQVLATSRAPLHVAGEQEYLVDPLGLPGEGIWAMRSCRATRSACSSSVLVRPIRPQAPPWLTLAPRLAERPAAARVQWGLRCRIVRVSMAGRTSVCS